MLRHGVTLLMVAALLLVACENTQEPALTDNAIGPNSPDTIDLATVVLGNATVSVRGTNLIWSPINNTASMDVYLVNTGSLTVGEPVNLVVTGIDPSSVTLSNPDGFSQDGKPYRTYSGRFGSDGVLTPDEESGTVPFVFDTASNASFALSLRLDDGNDSGAISGVVFADTDEDGIRDPGENGIEGIQVSLVSSISTQPEQVIVRTSATGDFAFGGLKVGAYTVRSLGISNGVATTSEERLVVLLEENDGSVATRDNLDFGYGGVSGGATITRVFDFNDGRLPPWRGAARMQIVNGTLQLSAHGGLQWRYEILDPASPGPYTSGSVEFDVKCGIVGFRLELLGHSLFNASDYNWGPFVDFNGLIVGARTPDFTDTGYRYEVDTWYRVRVVFDNARGSKGQYDLYIRDLDAGTAEESLGKWDYYASNGRLSDMSQYGFTLRADATTSSTIFVDNVQVVFSE